MGVEGERNVVRGNAMMPDVRVCARKCAQCVLVRVGSEILGMHKVVEIIYMDSK